MVVRIHTCFVDIHLALMRLYLYGCCAIRLHESYIRPSVTPCQPIDGTQFLSHLLYFTVAGKNVNENLSDGESDLHNSPPSMCV